MDIKSALFIGGEKVNDNFLLASRNIPNIDILPSQGLNVYSILKRDFLILSEDALHFINLRFKNEPSINLVQFWKILNIN